jgi:hypothetical protein
LPRRAIEAVQIAASAAGEASAHRRARRWALLLMAMSSAVTIGLLATAWWALRNLL